MNGWIKLSKKLLNWEWFDKSEMVHLFIYLLLSANYENGKWHGIDVKRGSFLTSLSTINQHTHLSKQTLRTCMDRLKSTHEITCKTTNKFTLITICKYEDYQIISPKENKEINTQDNIQVTNNQHATNIQVTTTKEYKEEEEINNNIIASKKRAVFHPPTLLEIQDFILENSCNKVNAEYFFNHYESNGWMAGRVKMKSWKATIRVWQLREQNSNVGIVLKNNSPDKYKKEQLW